MAQGRRRCASYPSFFFIRASDETRPPVRFVFPRLEGRKDRSDREALVRAVNPVGRRRGFVDTSNSQRCADGGVIARAFRLNAFVTLTLFRVGSRLTRRHRLPLASTWYHSISSLKKE
ncbi:unnamed protein product [Scytosiphon promiscuus]